MNYILFLQLPPPPQTKIYLILNKKTGTTYDAGIDKVVCVLKKKKMPNNWGPQPVGYIWLYTQLKKCSSGLWMMALKKHSYNCR